MKITLLSTYYKNGGAAIACKRLFEALCKAEGISAKLVVTGDEEREGVVSVSKSFLGKVKRWMAFIQETLTYMMVERSLKYRYAFSPAVAGVQLVNVSAVKESEVLNLHWVNQGFISLKTLEKLRKSRKRIVITLHDMWLFTGGCHYTGECRNFSQECGFCPYLKNPRENDLSYQVWKKKKKLFSPSFFSVVTCSNWLKKEAEKSSLLQGINIEVIPNPINTDTFFPVEKTIAKRSLGLKENIKYILFGTMNVNEERKGFVFLKEALENLKAKNYHLLIFGKASEEMFVNLPLSFTNFGKITDESILVNLYSAADVFVLPSLEDNLPNTVMEALSCGTPCVAFETGGLGDLIENRKNGYLARFKSSEDLAKGINWILESEIYQSLSEEARNKVVKNFSESVVSDKYLKLFQNIIIQ